MYSNDTEFLVHHGIKGMKWGVRRERKSSVSSKSSRSNSKKTNPKIEKAKSTAKSTANKAKKAAASGAKKAVTTALVAHALGMTPKGTLASVVSRSAKYNSGKKVVSDVFNKNPHVGYKYAAKVVRMNYRNARRGVTYL